MILFEKKKKYCCQHVSFFYNLHTIWSSFNSSFLIMSEALSRICHSISYELGLSDCPFMYHIMSSILGKKEYISCNVVTTEKKGLLSPYLLHDTRYDPSIYFYVCLSISLCRFCFCTKFEPYLHVCTCYSVRCNICGFSEASDWYIFL